MIVDSRSGVDTAALSGMWCQGHGALFRKTTGSDSMDTGNEISKGPAAGRKGVVMKTST